MEEKTFIQLGDAFIALSAHSNIIWVSYQLQPAPSLFPCAMIHVRGVETPVMVASNKPEYHALLTWLKKNSTVLLGGKIANEEHTS